MGNLSQTQLANYIAFAGVIVLLANKFGFVLDQNEVVFVSVALITLGSSAYNFYNRFRKGDLTLGGLRK